MPVLDLSPDEVLTTTRAVRKRLDLTRPVEPALIQECLELALQAPTGANSQGWHFVVVTASEQRQALAAIYRKGWAFYLEHVMAGQFQFPGPVLTDERLATLTRILHSTQYLADHLHEVPVLVVPCLEGRVVASASSAEQAGFWGSILPAIWSFMLAARTRGLGTCLTSVHLFYEQGAAQVLGISYAEVTQAALIPLAYTLGTDFKPASRLPVGSVLHWNRW